MPKGFFIEIERGGTVTMYLRFESIAAVFVEGDVAEIILIGNDEHIFIEDSNATKHFMRAFDELIASRVDGDGYVIHDAVGKDDLLLSEQRIIRDR